MMPGISRSLFEWEDLSWLIKKYLLLKYSYCAQVFCDRLKEERCKMTILQWVICETCRQAFISISKDVSFQFYSQQTHWHRLNILLGRHFLAKFYYIYLFSVFSCSGPSFFYFPLIWAFLNVPFYLFCWPVSYVLFLVVAARRFKVFISNIL